MSSTRILTWLVLSLFLSTPLLAKIRSDRERSRAEAEHACYGDAQRLCPDAIPDEAKVTACMTAKRAQLSPTCGKVFDRGLNP